MKVKDILTLAIKLLDKKELLSHSIFLPQPPQEIEESPLDKEIEDLLFCFNLIYDEIATDFMPLIHTEKIFFENGEFEFKNLEKTMLDIFALTDTNGRKIKFKTYPDKLLCNQKEAVITYSYQPNKLGFEDEIALFQSRVPARVFAYGVAMENCFLNSLSTEALIWENRYKNSLLTLTRKKTEVVLPARRWIWCLPQKDCF